MGWNRLKKYVKAVFWTAVLIAVFFLGRSCANFGRPNRTVKVYEIVEVPVMETVIRWHERVIWKESKPDTMWIYDTVVLVDTIWKDLEEGETPATVVHADFEPGKLFLTGMKFYWIDSVGMVGRLWRARYRVKDHWTLIAQKDSLFVKTRYALKLSLEPGLYWSTESWGPVINLRANYGPLGIRGFAGYRQFGIEANWSVWRKSF